MTIGRDEAAFTVVDGWLYAEGVRSHFSLRPEDVWSQKLDTKRLVKLVLVDKEEIWIKGIDSAAKRRLEIWHNAERWMEGEPTFPPAKVHREIYSRWGFYIVAGCLLKQASTYFRLGTDLVSGWTRTLLHQFLWITALILIIFGASKIWKLLKLDASSVSDFKDRISTSDLNSYLGPERTIELDPEEIRVSCAE